MKTISLAALSLLLTFTLMNCGKEDKTPPDPDGTNTISINYTATPSPAWAPIELYKGTDESPFSPSKPYVYIRFGIYDNSMNFIFFSVAGSDLSFGDYYSAVSRGGEMVNLGKVNGLGAIVTKPTNGWAASSAAEVGHGYVLRYQHTFNYGLGSSYYYYRVFVTDYIKNTNGGVIGVKVKYQGPF